MKLTAVRVVTTILIVGCVSRAQQPAQKDEASTGGGAKPLLLEKDEGEQRIWRDPPPGGFILKVSPENNGSQHLVLTTGNLLPGDSIPTHKHLGQDEIVFIQAGTAHIRLGDQERDLHAGGVAFIPAHTWVGLKNISSEPLSIVAIFSAPGFENHLRCVSVLPNEKSTPMSPEEHRKCDREGHVVYQELK